MKKSLLLLVGIGLISVSFAQVKFEKSNLDKAKDKALTENKLVFVDIYATWCGPCKMLDKNVFSDKQVGQLINSNFVPLKIDGDKDEHAGAMMEFEIEAFPTLIFLDPKTNRITKLVGYIDVEELKEEINFFIHPESHPVNKYRASIQGELSRDNHREIIQLMADDRSENSSEMNAAVANYMEKFPDLDLKNEMDILIFNVQYYAWEHPLIQHMISNPTEFDSEVRTTKFIQILQHHLDEAIDERNESIVLNQFEIMFPYFEDVLDEISKDDFTAEIRKIYQANQ